MADLSEIFAFQRVGSSIEGRFSERKTSCSAKKAFLAILDKSSYCFRTPNHVPKLFKRTYPASVRSGFRCVSSMVESRRKAVFSFFLPASTRRLADETGSRSSELEMSLVCAQGQMAFLFFHATGFFPTPSRCYSSL